MRTVSLLALATVVALAPFSARAEESWPYRPDLPLPPGFHVEKRANRALLITGASVAGGGILLVVTAFATRHGDAKGCHDYDCSNGVANSLAVGGALLIGAGLVLALVGVARPRLVVLRGDPPKEKPTEPTPPDKEPTAPRLMLGPSSIGTGAGFAFSGAF